MLFFLVVIFNKLAFIQICKHFKNLLTISSQPPAILVVKLVGKALQSFQIKNNLKSYSSVFYSSIATVYERAKIHAKHTIDKYAISGRNVLLHLFFDEQNVYISNKKIITLPLTPD